MNDLVVIHDKNIEQNWFMLERNRIVDYLHTEGTTFLALTINYPEF
jgi:hypothetical protein